VRRPGRQAPRVVPRGRLRARGALARPALLALLVVALGVFHIWSRTRVLSAGYALGELQKEHQRLTSEHDRLRIEVETLRSPATLERFARTRLGMAPPAPGAVQAAGPRLALAGGGGKDVDGVVVTTPGPAEPSRSEARETSASERAPAQVALRVLVQGRTPPGR
jgi:cell division protein FtsL